MLRFITAYQFQFQLIYYSACVPKSTIHYREFKIGMTNVYGWGITQNDKLET